MAKELVVNQTFTECRAALVENGEIIDFLMERRNDADPNTPQVGNIYKGKVLRVLPGMQSAFVDIGYEKAAFLYVDDAYLPSLEEQRSRLAQIKKEEEDAEKRVGEVIPDEFSTLTETVSLRFRPEEPIESFIKEGQEIIVQVAKEPISTKGPRVTRHITLAGRYVVYMPFIEHVGVSRRIESDVERERLKDVIESIRPEGTGIIARTVADGQSYKVLKADYNVLVKVWKDIQKNIESSKPAKLLYCDLSFVQRVLRDITDEDVAQILLDDSENMKEAERFVHKFLPTMQGKIKLYNDETPIFEKYGIDHELERGINNKVYLRSGGSLNIDQTEALVSVDVNTGKFIGRKSLEDTILKTNLEAVREIAYQLRLRNCGGIIIIDFIDMEKEENRQQVYEALIDALKKDRAKTNVLPISGLGLVEMTRKRTRDTLIRTICQTCPYCEGTGRIKTPATVCFELIRELEKVLKSERSKKIHIYAHPEVSAKLCDNNLDIIEKLEEKYGKSLIIRSENAYHLEQFEIFSN